MSVLKRFAAAVALTLLLLTGWAGWRWMSVVESHVEFASGDLTLRGTLLSPRLGRTTPAVVLVHGSGEVTRKSMLAYAWLFALKGYSALTYDKRGVGLSDGEPHEWREFRFGDLAADAAAAYRFLQTQPQVDPTMVGFFGASQGGWVVSLAANQVDEPAFIVMASASVSTVAEDRLFGREAQVRSAGFDETAVAEASALLRADHEATRSGHQEKLLEHWNTYKSRAWFKAVFGNKHPESVHSDYRSWQRTTLDFDPVPLLNRIDSPVLWIFGDPELDRFSPVALSLNRVNTLRDAGARYRIIQIDGVGHTLEPPEGGLIELMRIRIPLVLDIYDWLDDVNPKCQ